MMHTRLRTGEPARGGIRAATAAAAVACAGMIVLTACGGEPPASSTPAVEATETIGAQRCQQNRDAGKIIYLTSYDLGGGAGVLAEVGAEGLGFYDDLCLDVEVRAKTDNNAQLVSAGQVQIAGLGSAGDAMAAYANGAQILGIGTFGNVGQVAMATMTDGPVRTLDDLVGRNVGFKGTVPIQMRAMFEADGVDFDQVEAVKVGFDPRILPQGQVDAVQVYKDNEPAILESEGYDVTIWDPAEYGVKGTFSPTIVNTKWAEQHPTAVEDFLRATYHAFDLMVDDPAILDEAIAYSESVSQAGFDAEHERQRWKLSSDLIVANLLPGHGVGYQTADLWQPEADALVEYGVVTEPIDVAAVQTSKYVDAIYDGPELIWPAPDALAP